MKKSTASVVWGSGAMLMLSVGVLAGWQTAVDAAAARTAQPQVLPFAAGNTGNGVSGGNNGNGAGNGAGTVTPTGKNLKVSGAINGPVAPGVDSTLTVTIQNPNNQAVNIVSATASIDHVGTKTLPDLPACSKDWVTVVPYTGSKRLAAGATTTIDLAVSFDNKSGVNQDNCKGVSYGFTARATANQA